MSLYNMVHGVNQATFFILPMLGKHPDEYPRFRDCFCGDDEHPEYDEGHILVYTRVGGGNRESYQDEIKELRKASGYVWDYDDSFDCTFASFIFKAPEKWKADYDAIREGRFVDISPPYIEEMKRVYPKLTEKIDEIFNGTKEATDDNDD